MSTGLWEKRYVKKTDDIYQKARFDWFSKRAYQEYLKWITPSDRYILDAGFGTGRFCYALARDLPESEITGIDISGDLVKNAIKGAKILGLGNVFFRQDSIFNLSFPDNHFDVVFNEGVIEHFSNYEDALAEMVRVTKPGGKVIVGVPNWYCFPHTIRKFFINLFGLKYEYGLEKSFTHKELRELCLKNSLTDLEFTGYYFMQSLNRLCWISGVVRRMWRLSPVFNALEKMGQIIDDQLISRIDNLCHHWVSIKFGFEIVVKGIKR
ncbi:MAG: class I SAM-dependent methyltransferase [bacterium]|nr:class I SAM-dependent methyltransferase [bacterium]